MTETLVVINAPTIEIYLGVIVIELLVLIVLVAKGFHRR